MATLHQVYLMTADLERARGFYEATLGLTPAREGETTVSYRTGECELKLQADFDPDVLAAFEMEPPPDAGRGAGAVYVVELDGGIEAVHERALAAVADGAGAVLTEPREVPWGGEMFLVRDPDGYTFEVRAAGDP